MGKKIKKLVRIAAPAVGFIPGLQPLAAAGLGAGLGALSGGGLKGALAGGLGAYGIAGGGASLGSSLSNAGGLGLSTAQASALGNGLLGAGVGGAQGGLKGAALGGVAGGIGGYASAGGFDGTAVGDFFGSGVNQNLGYSPGEIASGAIGTTSAPAASGSLAGNGFSNLAKYSPVLNALGSFNEYGVQDDIEEKLLEQQRRAEGLLSPFTTSKFEPGDLTQDPGYQFRLQQGQEALDRSLAASGGLQSGKALKAAQEYGQGLADQTYNDAYRRYLEMQGFNLGAARSVAGVYDNLGNIGANAEVGRSNALSKALSSLGGSGARTIIGYDPRTGAPIYSE